MNHIDIDDKYSCCGCGACEAGCPVGAIALDTDEEGFLYPSIDAARCVECGKCLKLCAFRADRENPYPHGDTRAVRAYAVRHTDETVRAKSRSGGIFTALTDATLRNGGVVYGFAMDGVLRARHARAEDAAGRDAMRGSKYIESDARGVFPIVEADLKAGREVLFSGTSCQVAGLRSYLGSAYENLLCVDIVCHGVPSPKVWADYVAWMERRRSAKCTAADFRDKGRFGWMAHKDTLYFGDGTDHVSGEVFTRLFYAHLILRRSCFVCPYKALEHPGDITIGDYWHCEEVAPELNDDKGLSLVLVNTQGGAEAFEAVKPALIWKTTDIEKSMQQPLRAPFPEPADRQEFWDRYRAWDFERIARKYGTRPLSERVKGKLKQALKGMIGRS